MGGSNVKAAREDASSKQTSSENEPSPSQQRMNTKKSSAQYNYRFRCEDIDLSTSLASGGILHLKGFARRLDQSLVLPETAISLMRSFEVIAFDGDAIHPESFTKFLVSLLSSFDSNDSLSTSLIPPKILAYRLDYSSSLTEESSGHLDSSTAVKDVSRDSLFESWHHTVATLHDAGHITLEQSIDQEFSASVGSQCSDNPRQPLSQEVTIFVKTLLPSTTPEQRSPYLELGLQALLNSGSSHVLAVGGGAIVGEEYDFYLTQIPCLQWHAWLVDRAVAPGSVVEKNADGGQREQCYFQKHVDVLLENVHILVS